MVKKCYLKHFKKKTKQSHFANTKTEKNWKSKNEKKKTIKLQRQKMSLSFFYQC